jgi:DNA-binding MarR family transcriptional regulator/N-acetylglutamate synthase-like GNAT family acetyltransferase
MPPTNLQERIQSIRRFNRFYTRTIGILEESVFKSPFSLTEVRVLYELAHSEQPTAGAIADDLGLDAGYLSRILTGFKRRGLIRKHPSDADGRQSLLRLTRQGLKAFASLNARADEQIGTLLGRLADDEQKRLVAATHVLERLLGGKSDSEVPYLLRTHQPGDMGWVVFRHGVLYAREYGYDERFEALVAEIVAHFIHNLDPKRERCWIAERDSENVGSVFLVKKSAKVAKLRLLLVEPSARGLGIGRRLVKECVQFAHRTGYRKIVLWTNEGLHAARHIYEKAGFKLVHEEPHNLFGDGLVGQTWELML